MLQKNREIIWNSAQETWALLQGKHLFLTGGTGFFGKSLLDLVNYFNVHKNLNLTVTILTRNPDKFKLETPHLLVNNWIHFIAGDITSFQFNDIKCDHILHFATPVSARLNSEATLEMIDVICDGSKRVLEFAKYINVKSVLLTSSGAVYGSQPSDLINVSENFVGAPETNKSSSAYGEAKRLMELLGCLYSDFYGFECKIARCFAFIGPYLDPNGPYAITNFIRDAILNQNIIIKGDGSDYRSYMHSDDLIVSLFKILILGKNKQPYNVGSDQSISILDLAKKVVELVNNTCEIEILKSPIPGAPPNRYVPSIELIKNELNFTPATSLEEAILETANYYANLKFS